MSSPDYETAAPTRKTGERVARHWRRPSRAAERGAVVTAAAIPAGSQRVRRASTWPAQVAEAAEAAYIRADARARLRYLALALLERSDGTHTCPTWALLQERTGWARSSLARWLAWLRNAGLLATVASGRQARYAPAGQTEADAAVYVLCEPATHQEPARVTVDISETPPRTGLKENPRTHARGTQASQAEPLRGTPHRAATRLPGGAAWRHLTPWPGNITPCSKDNMLAAAAEVQNRVPLLRRITARHVRSILRPLFAAGWTVTDVCACIDFRPDGARWPHSGGSGVDNIGAWLSYRLRPWTNGPGGGPRRSPGQRATAEAAEHRARARARAEADRAARTHASSATASTTREAALASIKRCLATAPRWPRSQYAH